jgi:hypothetical protein
MRPYACICGAQYTVHDNSTPGCPRCGVTPSGRAHATARVIECPTYYVIYRGRSQEVDTLHLDEAPDGDENRRFSASFYHTPLDSTKTVVHGHSPSDVLAKAKEAIETAPWDVHFRQAIDRCTKAENKAVELGNRVAELEGIIESLKSTSP